MKHNVWQAECFAAQHTSQAGERLAFDPALDYGLVAL
jgi:hypothetical protein